MEWLTTFMKYAPNIIQEAAKSTLGILALLIISFAVISILFFRTANEKMRLVVFIFLFVGVAGYTYAIFRISESRWYVVVASVKTIEEAAAKVSEAKEHGFDQAEYVLKSPSKFIAVIVGKDLTTAQAIELKLQAKQSISSDPYLWPFTK